MSLMFRDKAHCVRSARSAIDGQLGCYNRACDRFVDETVKRLAEKAKLPIGWADLQTSKCGFVPREGE